MHRARETNKVALATILTGICRVANVGGRAWDGGRRHEAPASLAQLPLCLDFGHEAVGSRHRQVGQGQLPILRHQRTGQLALKDAGRLARLQLLRLQPPDFLQHPLPASLQGTSQLQMCPTAALLPSFKHACCIHPLP